MQEAAEAGIPAPLLLGDHDPPPDRHRDGSQVRLEVAPQRDIAAGVDLRLVDQSRADTALGELVQAEGEPYLERHLWRVKRYAEDTLSGGSLETRLILRNKIEGFDTRDLNLRVRVAVVDRADASEDLAGDVVDRYRANGVDINPTPFVVSPVPALLESLFLHAEVEEGLGLTRLASPLFKTIRREPSRKLAGSGDCHRRDAGFGPSVQSQRPSIDSSPGL